MWQEIIVAVCVISALIFLVRKWFFSKKSSSCGGCSDCGKGKSSGRIPQNSSR